MLNQRPISARISHQTMWEMELETQVSGMSRNRILNEGARLYLSLLDTRRLYRSVPSQDDRQKILNGFLKLWFPEAAK